jgi:hypothetical protein
MIFILKRRLEMRYSLPASGPHSTVVLRAPVGSRLFMDIVENRAMNARVVAII